MLGGSTGYSSHGINGVVRFVQINDNECVVDGTIDGLSPGKHGFHVYECGDLSNGCDRLIQFEYYNIMRFFLNFFYFFQHWQPFKFKTNNTRKSN